MSQVMLTISLPPEQVDVMGREAVPVPGTPEAADRALAEAQAEFQAQIDALQQQTDRQQAELAQTAEALATAGKQLESLQQEMIAEMQQRVVDLAMDVARKVVMQKITSEDFNIDPIVTEALSQIPPRGKILVRLNANDLQRSELASGTADNATSLIKFVADPSVPAGGCVAENAEGCVESSPEASLQQIDQTMREEE